MNEIINNHNIEGPINLLFTRSHKSKKKDTKDYNMSGLVPKIKVETENMSRPTVKVNNPISVGGIDLIKDPESDNESEESGSTVEANVSKPNKTKTKMKMRPAKSDSKFNPEDYQNFVNSSKAKHNTERDESDESEGSDEGSEGSDEYSDYSDSGSETSKKSKKDPKLEKQEILLKLLALEKKGINLSKKYSMSSKLSDLRFELELHKNNAEVDVSVKFQQKLLMAAVTGLEFANKKFDPIGAKLDGWSESIMENLDDYESVFIRLHEKYKKRAELPPELQLLVTLVGSGFMFHITKSLFSSSMPDGLNNVQSSEIMKNIAAAMSKQNPPKSAVSGVSTKEISGPSMNLSNMLKDDDNDSESSGSVETSKEVTINQRGKRAINL
tara:strand:- start:2302 stop:3453 length:1152 start_codon:yes stop_codon:yes gene_type:complete